MSSEKKGPWLVGVYIGDEKLPSYIGIIINHDIRIPINQPKNPTENKAFLRVVDQKGGLGPLAPPTGKARFILPLINRCNTDLLIPKDPFVCPFRKGLGPRTIPILFGWDWNPKNPIRSGGVGGFLGHIQKPPFCH